MSFNLVHEAPPGDVGGGVAKDIGDNVFLRDLPAEYAVFLFYYPSAMPDDELEEALTGLGELAGKNLLVNIGRLNDPEFARVVKLFEIGAYPVVVITAAGHLAASADGSLSAFVRLDDKNLLSDPVRTADVAQRIFTLFLTGEVAKALSTAKSVRRKEGLRAVLNVITRALAPVAHFFADRDIAVSLATGTFELKKRAGAS